MEKKPHRNQYEEPHFTCVIHYTVNFACELH